MDVVKSIGDKIGLVYGSQSKYVHISTIVLITDVVKAIIALFVSLYFTHFNVE